MLRVRVKVAYSMKSLRQVSDLPRVRAYGFS